MNEDVPPRGICYAQLATTLGAVVMYEARSSEGTQSHVCLRRGSAALVSYSISVRRSVSYEIVLTTLALLRSATRGRRGGSPNANDLSRALSGSASISWLRRIGLYSIPILGVAGYEMSLLHVRMAQVPYACHFADGHLPVASGWCS